MNYTPLYPSHVMSRGKIVNYYGWALPAYYSSPKQEYTAVRSNVGVFDISHMAIHDIHGMEAKAFLRYLLSNDVEKLDVYGVGKILYSAILNQEAGIIDDLIVYLMPFGYRLVTNSATEVQVLSWIKQIAAGFKVEIFNRNDLAIIAVQGPQAINKVADAKPHMREKLLSLTSFMSIEDNNYLYAQTKYTGGTGLEIMLPKEEANLFWLTLLDHQVVPCGLYALNMLRVESGVNLYGAEINNSFTPISCNIDWAVDLTDTNRDFMGKKAYQLVRLNPDAMQLMGAMLYSSLNVHHGHKVMCNGLECGVVTSGIYSPILQRSIAIIRIHSGLIGDFSIEVRGKLHAIEVVPLPFIRDGKILF